MPKGWRWAIQAIVAVAVLALVWHYLAANWAHYRAVKLPLEARPWWIALSFCCLAVVTSLQIESWRRLIAGWHRAPRFLGAVRVWCLSNLGRYIPGKVWSVAGMVVLAEQEGIPRWAAGASAFAVQALGLGTAAALVAATVPHAYSPLQLAAAAAVAVGTIALVAWPGGMPRLGRLLRSASEWRALPPPAVFASAALTLAAWCAYGVAFWSLARGLGLTALSLRPAAGIFALGYVLGMLAVFVPGGLGVREGIFFTLLAPHLGVGAALALSVASRVQLTLTEGTAGLLVLLFVRRQKKEELLDAARR